MNEEIPVFKDEVLNCCECGAEFIFEAGEARFYWSKQLSPVKRCEACRRERKLRLIKREDRQNA